MKISVIGTGNMGSAVALGLIAAGHQVNVWNRTRTKAERLAPKGARVAGSAAEAIAIAEYSILVLFDEKSTREVLLADDTRQELGGHVLISAAATTPEEIVALSDDVAAEGASLAEVNILTYPQAVQDRRSEFIIAADPAHSATWARIFSDLGPKVYQVGAVGNAARAQLSLWLSYQFLTLAMSYSVAAFERLGLPVNVAQSVLGGNEDIRIGGAAQLIPDMENRRYGSERWSVDNMVLSIDQAIGFAKGLGIDTTLMQGVRETYARAAAMGYGGRDITAVYEVINPRR